MDNYKLKLIFVDTLIKAAALATDLQDEDNKKLLLDIAEKYLSDAKADYTSQLDEDVISIVDDVRNSLNKGE